MAFAGLGITVFNHMHSEIENQVMVVKEMVWLKSGLLILALLHRVEQMAFP